MLFPFGVFIFVVTVLANITLVLSNDEIKAGENRHYELNPEDAISLDKLAVVGDAGYTGYAGYGFPGDLIVGYRLSNEVVYTRSIAINNPTDEVKTGLITFSINRGEFHYVSAINRAGSVGVMCDEPYIIGGSQTGFKVRSQPNSQVILDVTFAAH